MGTFLQLCWAVVAFQTLIGQLLEGLLVGEKSLTWIRSRASELVTESLRLQRLTDSWYEESLRGHESRESDPAGDELPF